MKNCENQTDHAVISGGFEYFFVAQQKSSKIFLQHIISYKISAKKIFLQKTKFLNQQTSNQVQMIRYPTTLPETNSKST